MLIVAILVALGGLSTAAAGNDALPAGPGRDLVYGKCQTCHSLQYLEDSAGISRDQWASVLDDMALYGLALDEDQHARVLDYLATYLGPDPPQPSTNKAAHDKAASISGKAVFEAQCSACHQADGRGQPGTFPPLAGNDDLFLTADYPVLVAINGLRGPIHVDGHDYDGRMPPMAFLSDAKIAAVVRYIRSAWGNDARRPQHMPKPTAADVDSARQTKMDANAVHAYRAQHARE